MAPVSIVPNSGPATHTTCLIPSRGSILQLNADVLLLIFELLLKRDLAHLMQTCRPLYTLGIPSLIKDVQMVLGRSYMQGNLSATPVDSLCEFFEADNWSRCGYVRSLVVSSTTDGAGMEHDDQDEEEEEEADDQDDESAEQEQNSDDDGDGDDEDEDGVNADENDNDNADEDEDEDKNEVEEKTPIGPQTQRSCFLHNMSRLANVLERCTSLRSLVLFDTTPLLTSFPAIATALTSLRSIRAVSIQYGDGRDFLKRMQSRVAVVYLNDGSRGQLYGNNHACPVADVLRHMASSLQALYIRQPDLTLQTTSFPRLKTLMILLVNVQDLDIRGMVNTFPNLQYLNLGIRSGSMNIMWRMLSRNAHVIAEMETKRQRNIQLQQTKKWTSLDTVCGNIWFLYALAAACPIRYLHLTSTLEDSETHMHMWTTVLRDSQASAVQLEATTSSLSLERSSLMIPPSHPLTHLRFEYTFLPGGASIFRSNIQENLLRLIRIDTLTYLDFQLKWVGAPEPGPYEAPDHVHKNVGIFLANLQLADFARTIAKTLPKLRIISLATSLYEMHPDYHDGDRRTNKGLWTIDRDETGLPAIHSIPTHLQPGMLRLEKMLDFASLGMEFVDYVSPYDKLF